MKYYPSNLLVTNITWTLTLITMARHTTKHLHSETFVLNWVRFMFRGGGLGKCFFSLVTLSLTTIWENYYTGAGVLGKMYLNMLLKLLHLMGVKSLCLFYTENAKGLNPIRLSNFSNIFTYLFHKSPAPA